MEISAHAAGLAERMRSEFTSLGVSFMVDSPTNQQFPILPDDVLAKLEEKYVYEYQKRVDANHSAVRFCTSWATKEADVEALLKDIREYFEQCPNC